VANETAHVGAAEPGGVPVTTTYAPDFDAGDIPRVGEHTTDLTYRRLPPVFRRAEATGEIPIIRPDTGLNILRPAMPAAPLYRRRRGRHRREPSVLPVLLLLVGLWAVGCGAALRLVGAW
jgi:hypothetical protein